MSILPSLQTLLSMVSEKVTRNTPGAIIKRKGEIADNPIYNVIKDLIDDLKKDK